MRSFTIRPNTASGEAASKARRHGPNRLTSAIAATAAAAMLCAVAMPALAVEHTGGGERIDRRDRDRSRHSRNYHL